MTKKPAKKDNPDLELQEANSMTPGTDMQGAAKVRELIFWLPNVNIEEAAKHMKSCEFVLQADHGHYIQDTELPCIFLLVDEQFMRSDMQKWREILTEKFSLK
jgi:hypothetical protein